MLASVPMKLPERTEVLIVGAGPTGLVLAGYLRMAGIDVTIVDRADGPSMDSRAAIVHVRALELLDPLGISKVFEEQGVPVANAAFFDMGSQVCDLDFEELGSHHPHAIGIEQQRVERLLGERLQALGTSIARGYTLKDLSQDDNEVAATLTDPQGNPHQVVARYLVGCDGARSTVRKICGLDGDARQLREGYAIADVPIHGDLAPDTMHFYAADSGFAVIWPIPDGLWRLTATLHHINRTPTREDLQQIISDRGPRASQLDVGPPAIAGSYRIRRTIAASLRDGRVLLAGDAAHTFSPATAQGMNTGIADAVNLWWKLAEVVFRQTDDELLDTYDSERRQAALDAVQRTDGYSEGPSARNIYARGLRNMIGLLAGRRDAMRLPMTEGLAGFDTEYQEGMIGREREASVWGDVGKRVNHLPEDMLGTGTFRLLCSKEEDRPTLEKYAEQWPVRIDVGVSSGGGNRFALVRPDDHIAWLGGRHRLTELSEFLEHWFTHD